jgi:hypothetical protein
MNTEKKKLHGIINDDSCIDKAHEVLMQLDERMKKRRLIYVGYLHCLPNAVSLMVDRFLSGRQTRL